MYLLRKKKFYLQQIESNNNSPSNSEGPYDTIDCNEISDNPSSTKDPLTYNIINNHDDVYSSDGTKNEDCDYHTMTSIVKHESSENKGSSLLKPSFVPKFLPKLLLFIFDLCDPQSEGRGSERTVISQHHRQASSIKPVYTIHFWLMLFLSLLAVATPDISCQMVPFSYPQCEGNSSDTTAPDWNHSILYMQGNKLSIKGNHSSMMSVYERQMDFKITCDIIFNCLLFVSCILFLIWYIVRLFNDNALQENVGRGQAHPQKMPRISAPSSLDPRSNSSTTTAPVPLFGYRDSCVKSTSLPAASEYNYLVSSLEHTRPPSSLLGDDGDTYLSVSDFDESEPIHSIVTSADSNGHLLVYQKTRKATQKTQLSLLILKKDDTLISEHLDDPGENLAVVGKAEYLEESDDDRYLHSQEQEYIKSADQLKAVREKGKKVSYSGDLSSSIIPIHQVHKNNIILENTLCVPNPPNQYPTSLKPYLPPPQSPSLIPSLELGCGVFTEAGYALSGCIAGPEEKFGLIELIPSLSDNDNTGHADPEPVVDDNDSVHDNGLYPCCFDVPCSRPFLAQSGP